MQFKKMKQRRSRLRAFMQRTIGAAFILLLHCSAATAQLNLANPCVRATISPTGTVQQLSFRSNGRWQPVDFRSDAAAGPTFHVDHRPLPMDKDPNSNTFYALQFGILYKLVYEVQDSSFVIRASIENRSTFNYTPPSAGLILGIDALMESYPQWNNKHFPTLLRAEKTHFWGYAMSPSGNRVSIASPDSVASWSIDYYKDHYIRTFTIDLLNPNPLPARHPAALNMLKPGEKKQWTIYLGCVAREDALKPRLAALCQAPMIEASGAYTLAPGEQRTIHLYSQVPVTATWTTPDSNTTAVPVVPAGPGQWAIELTAGKQPGQCRLLVRTAGGRQSEALFYQRNPWSYYLQQARDQTVDMPPQPAIYAESYYSAFSIYLGKQYVPNAVADPLLDSVFHAILPKMFSYRDGKEYVIPNVRVQSLYTGIGVLTQSYKAYGRLTDLDLAARLADHLINHYQQRDAAYRTVHGTYYTSVIYGTKPMFELAAIERSFAAKDTLWQHRAARHYQSAKRAVQDLLERLDNIETEGEQTFEDGMISCSALQLGFYALQATDTAERHRYTEGLRYLLEKHRCMEQTQVPDARLNGGTLRFWEAWYDIRLKPHVLNSPHGWSSWKTYATYYLYLLTGESRWLYETMDAVGSAMQVVDVRRNGYLNWGFIQDPYVQATYAVEDPAHKGKSIFTSSVIGEQYMPMTLRWRKDHGGDATVHEHFKMLAEVALLNAFVIQQPDGSFTSYNCTVKPSGNTLVVIPYENLVTHIHFNFLKGCKTEIRFAGGIRRTTVAPGLHWVHAAGARPNDQQ